jgi:hypothetical protein
MRRFDKHIPILSGLGDWARLRLILGGSNEYPPATVSSYTVVVSHLAFGTLSLRSINAPGGGVHGMCGFHAAKMALKDLNI